MDFFPYHPLKLRLWLLGGLLISSALTVWALFGFTGTQEPREILRAGLSMGLCAAMAVMFFKLRPRKDWGVRLTQISVLVSRPRNGLIEVPWSSVREIRRLGEKRDTLALWLDEEQRVLVPAHLFAKKSDFEALVKTLEERMPPPRYDA
ncbi:MAG: hypothetical protein DI536_35865 [Archangium gephyra]|uniref:Uncharacterized protein n=1 Tax=Archangium gephyra TaxID=48 RepID=A0A2W5SVS4_9BACT|nr:MAG: hypothetical protein DI536_35865 [Archangium gephyra]